MALKEINPSDDWITTNQLVTTWWLDWIQLFESNPHCLTSSLLNQFVGCYLHLSAQAQTVGWVTAASLNQAKEMSWRRELTESAAAKRRSNRSCWSRANSSLREILNWTVELPERKPGNFRKFLSKMSQKHSFSQAPELRMQPQKIERRNQEGNLISPWGHRWGCVGKMRSNGMWALSSTCNVISIFIIQKFSRRALLIYCSANLLLVPRERQRSTGRAGCLF